MTTLRLPAEWIEAFTEGLLAEADVRVEDIGVFRVRLRPARRGRNPRTGDRIAIPPRLAVSFRPAKALRDRLRVEETRPPDPDAGGGQARPPWWRFWGTR